VLRIHAGRLAGGEAVHAGVVGVVHEVGDRIHAGLRAGVAALRAAEGGAALAGGVVDAVALAAAAALEGVVEAEPVADLVGRGVAQVVGGGAAAGERGEQHDHAVVGRVVRVVGREGRPAEQPAAQVGGVQVERLGAADAERRLHGRLG